MNEKKQIAYYYDTRFNAEDMEIDTEGDMVVPDRGQILQKHGERWKVAAVMIEHKNDGSLSIHRVYLVKA
jgi:hypothetical protein